jgi:hypothetical protein
VARIATVRVHGAVSLCGTVGVHATVGVHDNAGDGSRDPREWLAHHPP